MLLFIDYEGEIYQIAWIESVSTLDFESIILGHYRPLLYSYIVGLKTV